MCVRMCECVSVCVCVCAFVCAVSACIRIPQYPSQTTTYHNHTSSQSNTRKRVTEVQTYTTPKQWKHCPGEDNPADYLSRGVTAEQLKVLQKWWQGPSWQSQEPHRWACRMARTHHPLPDERKQTLLVGSTETPGRLIESSTFSSYWKTAPCHGLGSSFCATREPTEVISRGNGSLRT